METAVPKRRSRGSSRANLAHEARLPSGRQVCVERRVEDDGIDRVRPSGRTENRPASRRRNVALSECQLRADVRRAGLTRQSGIAARNQVAGELAETRSRSVGIETASKEYSEFLAPCPQFD